VPNVTVSVSSPLGAEPSARFQQRVDADLALNALERAVRRLEQRFYSFPRPRPPMRRGSRRSAWLPSAD
jgi:hypothetical protein